jgi:hypothetical protein
VVDSNAWASPSAVWALWDIGSGVDPSVKMESWSVDKDRALVS